MDSLWGDPSTRDVTTTVDFINTEAPKVHNAFGGLSQYDWEHGKFVHSLPVYLQLEQALRAYIPTTLGIQYEGDTWDGLCEKINQAQKGHTDATKGTWHSIWYKMGDAKNDLDGWLNIIPDAYGIAMVKTGLAVVFKLAEGSNDRRKKIFNTFAGLRDALLRVDPTRKRFLTSLEVDACAKRLYETVVQCIDDMILLTSKEKSVWRKFSKSRDRKIPPKPEQILQKVTDATEQFERALNAARDQSIGNTEILSQYTAGRVDETYEIAAQTHTGVAQVMDDTIYLRRGMDVTVTCIEQETRENERRHQALCSLIVASDKRKQITVRQALLEDARLNAKNYLKDVLQVLFEKREREDTTESFMPRRMAYKGQKRGAVVSPSRLCQILTQSHSNEPPNLNMAFEHATEDFEQALVEKGRVVVNVQSQVQSLLRHDRFLQWINDYHSNLILVNANLRTPDLARLSAISVFSATFIASMLKVYPNEVIVYFFCGVHVDRTDLWSGPNGLLRSIIIQLVMKLVKIDHLSLDFIDNRNYLQDLEEHDLKSLCEVLHSLVSQFPTETTIYCIIDSVSFFDIDMMFNDLKIALEYLKRIVDDKSLVPIFKVMLTNPMQSTWRMKKLLLLTEDPSRLITLSPNSPMLTEISEGVIENHLLWTSTLVPAKPKPEAFTTASGADYADESDIW
ncbi:hypothetical protein EG329_008027 [Mollisiaceae sp. DMI_Dod_QoI]|nr:hypothetical protein EG329_008027 [Helotiales sp. DMI_Dod_QoI]